MATPAERIEQALARIETAAIALRDERALLHRRHARLRERVAEAVTAIDELTAERG